MNGVILYEGPSCLDGGEIVMIATGLKTPSRNRKTGPMIQTWILCQDVSPTQALRDESDFSICGDCKFRKDFCYVLVHQAPQMIWKTYQEGGYKHATPTAMTQYAVRLGAYGDPAAVPPHIIRDCVKHARCHTGYTHQWRLPGVQEYRQWLMASVDSEEEQQQARHMGWRTFRVAPAGEPIEHLPWEITCPNSTHGVTCLECRLCAGWTKGRFTRDIVIEAHGKGANSLR